MTVGSNAKPPRHSGLSTWGNVMMPSNPTVERMAETAERMAGTAEQMATVATDTATRSAEAAERMAVAAERMADAAERIERTVRVGLAISTKDRK